MRRYTIAALVSFVLASAAPAHADMAEAQTGPMPMGILRGPWSFGRKKRPTVMQMPLGM